MFKILLSLVGTFVTVHGAGELAILHSPDSIKFSGQEPLDESLLKEVFSASLGFTVSKGIDWPGITITDPFHYPEALVTVVIDGVAGLGLPSEIKAPRYPLNTNEDESITWQALHDRVLRRYLGQDPQLFRVDLPEQLNNVVQLFSEEESTPKNLSLRYLDPTVSEDKQFLKEMGLLLNIVKLVQFSASKQDGIKDFYWLVCRSLHAVCDLHGYDSEATKEAFQILGNTLQEVTKAFINAYTKDKVLVAAICSDVSHTRRTRSLLQQEEPVDLNLAPEYSPEYPVIFNIMLWFGVAFVFSLLAISLFIADMDPGRDSIIYRMTSTRMKKDN